MDSVTAPILGFKPPMREIVFQRVGGTNAVIKGYFTDGQGRVHIVNNQIQFTLTVDNTPNFIETLSGYLAPTVQGFVGVVASGSLIVGRNINSSRAPQPPNADFGDVIYPTGSKLALGSASDLAVSIGNDLNRAVGPDGTTNVVVTEGSVVIKDGTTGGNVSFANDVIKTGELLTWNPANSNLVLTGSLTAATGVGVLVTIKIGCTVKGILQVYDGTSTSGRKMGTKIYIPADSTLEVTYNEPYTTGIFVEKIEGTLEYSVGVRAL